MILRIVPIRRKIGAPPRAAPFGVVPPKRSASARRQGEEMRRENGGKMVGKWLKPRRFFFFVLELSQCNVFAICSDWVWQSESIHLEFTTKSWLISLEDQQPG
jgi:hypothetical protein